MLTGLLEPSGGQAEYEGINVLKDMQLLRENLGVCPQHNVLFEFLSVKEHLELYAAFKGVESDEIEAKVSKMIWDMELV